MSNSVGIVSAQRAIFDTPLVFSSGAVLLFAFFMVSDPMTTPQHARARMAYAVLVALAAFVWQVLLYRPHGLIVMLFVCSWSVPLWNRAWLRPRFAWDSVVSPT